MPETLYELCDKCGGSGIISLVCNACQGTRYQFRKEIRAALPAIARPYSELTWGSPSYRDPLESWTSKLARTHPRLAAVFCVAILVLALLAAFLVSAWFPLVMP